MLSTEAGISIDSRFEQLSNALVPILLRVSGKSIVVNPWQYVNASSSILSKDSGSMSSVRLLQLVNVRPLITGMFFERLILSNAIHPAKALPPTEVTLSVMVTVFSF